MHEYSVVQSLLEMCEEHAKKNDAKKVTKVTVKIGVLSGVEPQLLKTAFETFKEDTICEEAEFDMHIQNVKILCNCCKKESEPAKSDFSCPSCKSENITLLDGEEMYLLSLEMES